MLRGREGCFPNVKDTIRIRFGSCGFLLDVNQHQGCSGYEGCRLDGKRMPYAGCVLDGMGMSLVVYRPAVHCIAGLPTLQGQGLAGACIAGLPSLQGEGHVLRACLPSRGRGTCCGLAYPPGAGLRVAFLPGAVRLCQKPCNVGESTPGPSDVSRARYPLSYATPPGVEPRLCLLMATCRAGLASFR